MKNNIADSLNKLKYTDIYSLILFAIYKMKDIPEYSTLSELVYLLDKDSLYNLLEYFGGMTITIPTKDDMKTIVNALLLYQSINIEGKTEEEAKSELTVDEFHWDDTYQAYLKIVEIMSNYDFRRS